MMDAVGSDEEINSITETTSSSRRCWPSSSAARRRITIEPVTFIGSVGYGLIVAVRPEFIQFKIEQMNNSYYPSHVSNSTYNDQNTIKSEVALWLLYLSICSFFPAIFATKIIGTLSDSIGRKFALGVPIVGFIIQTATLLLVIGCDLPLGVLLISEVLQGCTGGMALLMCGSLAYIADVTTLEERTWRIVIIEVTLFVGGVMPSVTHINSGYLFIQEFVDFGGVLLCVSLLLLAITMLYIVIPHCLIETVEFSRVPVTFLKEVFLEGRALFEDNSRRGRRWRLLILNVLIVLIDVANVGFFSILILYVTDSPFHDSRSSVTVGYILAASFMTTGVGKTTS